LRRRIDAGLQLDERYHGRPGAWSCARSPATISGGPRS
jgi:hypothetical protein